MSVALAEYYRVLVPGGWVDVSSFGPTFLLPLRDLWAARLRPYGIVVPPLPTERLGDVATGEALLRAAGFTDLDVRVEQLGYHLPDAAARWADIVAGWKASRWFSSHLSSRCRRSTLRSWLR